MCFSPGTTCRGIFLPQVAQAALYPARADVKLVWRVISTVATVAPRANKGPADNGTIRGAQKGASDTHVNARSFVADKQRRRKAIMVSKDHWQKAPLGDRMRMTGPRSLGAGLSFSDLVPAQMPGFLSIGRCSNFNNP